MGRKPTITNKLLPKIEAWQKRPLSSVYPIVYIDAIIFNLGENNVIPSRDLRLRKSSACRNPHLYRKL